MPGELRESLELSFRELEKTPEIGGGEVVGEARELTVREPREVTVKEPKPEPTRAEPKPEERDPDDRTGAARDESGRFAPKTESKDTLPADQQPGKEATEKETPAEVTPDVKPPATKAPVSWKPEAREHWKDIPAAAQQEILRRDVEVTRALNESADARRFAQAFHQTVSPFEMFFRAEGVNALQACQNLLVTAARLRTDPPQAKAQLVGDLILQFSVDVEALDSYMSQKLQGETPANDPTIKYLEQRLAPVEQLLKKFETVTQQTTQQLTQSVEEEWAAFAADPANEFANDVAADMGDLLELAARRGQKLSLSDAYSRATMAHPTISKVLRSRAEAAQAAQQTAAARRAKDAAASVTGDGAPSRSEDNDDGSLRSAIAASMRTTNR